MKTRLPYESAEDREAAVQFISLLILRGVTFDSHVAGDGEFIITYTGGA